MKKIILLICLLGAFFTVSAANWYHFRSVSPSGHNLCYRYVNNSEVVVSLIDSSYNSNTHANVYSNTSYYITHLVGNVIIPDTVIYNNRELVVVGISYKAFANCINMTSVYIPLSCLYIDIGAFDGCTRLKEVTIPHNIKMLNAPLNGYPAWVTSSVAIFRGCDSLSIINYDADSCGFKSVFLGLGISNKVKVNIGNGVRYIPNGLFRNLNVDSLCLPSTVMSIADSSFLYCKLIYMSMSTNVSKISNYAFYGCSNLTSISLPRSLDSIGHYAFFGCSALTSLTIPESVTKIGNYAFARCVNIVSLTSLNPIPPQVYGDSTFHKVYKAIPLNVPSQSINTYKLAYGWRDFTNIVADTTIGVYQVTVTTVDTNMGQVKIILPYTPQNGQLVIQAIPNANYRFTHWSDGNQEAVRSLYITQDTNLVAYFASDNAQYTLTAVSDNTSMGSVSGGGRYQANSQVMITATPYLGYEFTAWQDGNTQSQRTITLVSDTTFRAYFRAKSNDSCTIQVVSVDTAMGITYGEGRYKKGVTTTIMAVPRNGYIFVQWQDGNTQDTRTITAVSDSMFVAYFRPSTGIEETEDNHVLVYSFHQNIVVKGAENESISIYDIFGRRIRYIKNAEAEYRTNVNSSGVYFVQVGKRKVVKVNVTK